MLGLVPRSNSVVVQMFWMSIYPVNIHLSQAGKKSAKTDDASPQGGDSVCCVCFTY